MASSYADAAACLAKVEKGSRSLKSAAYESRDPKKTYALCAEALKVRASLRAAIAATDLRDALGKHDGRVLLLACYDALAGRGLPKRAGGKLLRGVKERLPALRAAFEAHVATQAPAAPKPPARAVRYARVNPLRGATKASVRAALGDVGDELTDDAHLDEVLAFPGALASTLHGGHALVASGQIILQDKASCFPAKALLGDLPDDWRGDVLDACAAPGNKTTHAAALLGDRGAVHAFDRDARRLEILVKRAAEAGAAVRASNADFLAATVETFPAASKIRAVLLDPSCSGSGMDGVERNVMRDDADAARVSKLAAFQTEALAHALDAFPNAERVAYSTCSVHDAENEAVVAAALAARPGWRLRAALPAWPRRGRAAAGLGADDAAKLVRTDPAADDTIGFFLALFERGAPKRARDAGDGGAPSARNARRKAKRRKKKQAAFAAGRPGEGAS